MIIIPLKGLSAPVILAAASAARLPCLVCPVQGTYALPSSALAIGALQEDTVPVELLYAPQDEVGFREKAQSIIKAARAFSLLKESRVGIVGELFPNLVSCRYDPAMVQSRLGVTLLPISFKRLRALIGSGPDRNSQLKKVRQEINTRFKVDPAETGRLDDGIKLHLALKQLASTKGLDGFATECWSGFPREIGLNPCLGFYEDAYTLACEGDVLLSISLLIVRYLSGVHAYAGDLFDIDSEGLLTLVHCGGPASLSGKRSPVVLGSSQLAHERGFETMTCRPRLAKGPVTVFRLYGKDAGQLHVAQGTLVDCETTPNLLARIKLKGDRWEFLDQCFGNHYVVASGDIRHELAVLSKWLSIDVTET